MAFTTLYYESIVQLKDKGGNGTTRTYRLAALDDAGDISALVTAQNNLIVTLQAITACVILSVRLARVTINDAFALPSVAAAEVEAHALVSAKITSKPNKSAVIDIPGPVDGIFLGTSGKAWNTVDITDTDLVAFLNNFSGLTPPYTVSDGDTIVLTGAEGKRTHSSSTKG